LLKALGKIKLGNRAGSPEGRKEQKRNTTPEEEPSAKIWEAFLFYHRCSNELPKLIHNKME